MGDFERDTRLDGEDGRYRAALSPDWEIWGPNGGYLAAIALRAAGLEARVPRPACFNAHFLSVARFDAVDVEVASLRAGRRSESFRVSIRQDGKPVLEALVRTAAEGPGLEHDVSRAPEVPDPGVLRDADSLRAEFAPPDAPPPYPFWQNLECRPLHPERWDEPRRAREPLFREWLRFRPRATFEDPFLDAARALLLIDTLSWPAACQPHPDAAFTAPNLDVCAWFHRLAPDAEWLLIDCEADTAEAGLMGTRARVWGADRRLLASGGAQLFCVPSS